jgi:hypothetical protein
VYRLPSTPPLHLPPLICFFLGDQCVLILLLKDTVDQQGMHQQERWRFDQDDEPTDGLEGANEQHRVLIDDYDPKYVRHMMTLLSNPDHQTLSTDNTLVVGVGGHYYTVSPHRLGAQPQYVRRDQHGIQRVYPGGMSLSAARCLPSLKCAFHRTVVPVLLSGTLHLQVRPLPLSSPPLLALPSL